MQRVMVKMMMSLLRICCKKSRNSDYLKSGWSKGLNHRCHITAFHDQSISTNQKSFRPIRSHTEVDNRSSQSPEQGLGRAIHVLSPSFLTSSVLGQSKFQPQIWSLPVNMFMDIMQIVSVTVPTITSHGWEATRRPCIRKRRVSMVQQA